MDSLYPITRDQPDDCAASCARVGEIGWTPSVQRISLAFTSHSTCFPMLDIFTNVGRIVGATIFFSFCPFSNWFLFICELWRMVQYRWKYEKRIRKMLQLIITILIGNFSVRFAPHERRKTISTHTNFSNYFLIYFATVKAGERKCFSRKKNDWN